MKILLIALFLISQNLFADTKKDFLLAVDSNDLSKVKKMLDEGVDPNLDLSLGPNERGISFQKNWTAVLVATNRGHIEMLQLLVSYGADINHIGQYRGLMGFFHNQTALYISIQKMNEKLIRTLLELGADIQKRISGKTVFHKIDYAHSYERIENLLLSHSPKNFIENIIRDKDKYNFTRDYGWPNEKQSRFFYKLFERAIALGLDINLPVKKSSNLNFLNGFPEVVDFKLLKFLLDNGANPNLEGILFSNREYRRGALSKISYFNRLSGLKCNVKEELQLLLKSGYKPNSYALFNIANWLYLSKVSSENVKNCTETLNLLKDEISIAYNNFYPDLKENWIIRAFSAGSHGDAAIDNIKDFLKIGIDRGIKIQTSDLEALAGSGPAASHPRRKYSGHRDPALDQVHEVKELIKYLIENGYNLNSYIDMYSISMVRIASYWSVPFTKFLLEQGLKPRKNELHHAIFGDFKVNNESRYGCDLPELRFELIKLFIKFGADKKYLNRHGRTAYEEALKDECPHYILELLKPDINKNTSN